MYVELGQCRVKVRIMKTADSSQYTLTHIEMTLKHGGQFGCPFIFNDNLSFCMPAYFLEVSTEAALPRGAKLAGSFSILCRNTK